MGALVKVRLSLNHFTLQQALLISLSVCLCVNDGKATVKQIYITVIKLIYISEQVSD